MLVSFILANWQRAVIYGALVVAAFTIAVGIGYYRGVQRLWDYQVEQAQAAIRVVVKQGAVTERIVTRYVERKEQIRTIEKIVEKEIVRYVDAHLDDYPLSRAAVILHDAAAAGSVPDPAGAVDGTASGIKASALTQACTANYAEYHQVASRLISLQDWVRAQARVNVLDP